jgi:HD-GYP domain-containing protein (c-di-GMP phosphodiesterase class II)
MRAIAAIIDAKDGYTHRHSERVAGFAVRLARQLGWSPDECRVLELSGLLHDIGKIGVSDAILNKPGKLTPEEFAEVRRHPGHGAAILSHIQSPKVAKLLPGVMHHHERWDGTGYPDGLAGDDIPIFGRVLAVADFIDALTSDRSYRGARSIDDVVTMIQEESGRMFDPRVVEAAVTLHAHGELALPIAAGLSLR